MSSRATLNGISIGIYEKALPSDVDWDARLNMAAAAGFDFVEMSLDPSPERFARLRWDASQRAEVRRAVHLSGIPIRTMCLSAHRAYPLGTGEPALRAEGLDVLRLALDLAVDIGIRIVQVAGYDTLPDEPPSAASRARYTDGLAQGVRWAAERAVLLGMENQEQGYIDSPSTALKVIEHIGSPYLGLYMDIGNLTVNRRDTLAEVRAARGHLIGVHVKDARPGVPRRVPFGEGDVPFAAAFRRLADDGFAGPVMIEMWNDDRPDALDVAAAAREWVVARLREAGFTG
ncbi:MAG: L-ribulose-5-phosphate 3-epimerase [Anaerolineae bacterium]|nr:L-ribulose-5-phosphate 3-epimerase [Anaerolineae bacterium]